MSWVIEKWIVKKFGVLSELSGLPGIRDYTELGVAAEIRNVGSDEMRRSAARASLLTNTQEEAERKCRAKVQEWIDAMNAGTAIDRGLPLHTEDVLEGHEMRA